MAAYFEPVVQLFKPSWRSEYYRAKVEQVSQLAADVLSIELQVGRDWPCHQAGQHIGLTLELNGRLVTRVFTIASSPDLARTKRIIRLVIKQQSKGALTPTLNELTSGTWVNISSPSGEFLLPEQGQVLMLAAGSGITPFIAMLQAGQTESALEQIELIYYAKPGQHLLVDELAQLAKVLPNFSYRLLSRADDGDVAEQLASVQADQLMVCGPTEFYLAVAAFGEQQQLAVSSEHFSPLPVAMNDAEQTLYQAELNGKTIELSNSTPILSQLLAQDIKVAHGCGMGVCHQCHCVKKSGVVKDVRTGALSDRGEELIQLCVSQVMTDLELKV